MLECMYFFFQAEDGIRDYDVTGVQTCALPIWVRGVGAGRDRGDHDFTGFHRVIFALNGDFFAHWTFERFFHFFAEGFFAFSQGNEILWAFGARNGGNNCIQIGRASCRERV